MKDQVKTLVVLFTISTILTLNTFTATAQFQERTIPSVTIKTLDGKKFDTNSISNNGRPILIVVWETTCKSSLTELDALAENYEDLQKETGVKIIAISIDNSRTANQVSLVVDSREWKFETYSDINQDFKRAIGFSYCPFNLLLDNTGNIVWQKSSFAPGDEKVIYELIRKLANGEKIN
ncbi:MAG: TlpA family protein disulfide reductase [Bacteroidota bacterium]|nr:TlpA family protein disulfide reductase [Bacteroidota bacterium]